MGYGGVLDMGSHNYYDYASRFTQQKAASSTSSGTKDVPVGMAAQVTIHQQSLIDLSMDCQIQFNGLDEGETKKEIPIFHGNIYIYIYIYGFL